MPDYPNTGETGETYDLEFASANQGVTSKEAIEKARDFFKAQREQKLKRE